MRNTVSSCSMLTVHGLFSQRRYVEHEDPVAFSYTHFIDDCRLNTWFHSLISTFCLLRGKVEVLEKGRTCRRSFELNIFCTFFRCDYCSDFVAVVRGVVHLAADVGGVLLDGFDSPTCKVVQISVRAPPPTCPRTGLLDARNLSAHLPTSSS